jgi:hypothetical protein
MKKPILYTILISLVARILYFLTPNNIWWDAAVYLGMSKYISSLGEIGLWEPIRPLLWPTILAVLNSITLSHITTTLFSLGIIYLTYLIAKKLYNSNTALIATIILSFTWIFFFFNFRLYTEIPSTFFALTALYYFLQNKPYKTGLFTGLAFLTKFPQGLILILFLALKPKSAHKTLITFIATITPYLTLNYFLYGSPISNLLLASETLKHAGIWIFQQPWHYYLQQIPLQNLLYIFAIPGIYLAIKKKHYILALIPLAFLAYFTQMLHKEVRFTIIFLPYLSILAAKGLTIIKNKKIILLITLLVTSLFFAYNFEIEEQEWNPYYTYLENKTIDTNILITHPRISYQTNTKSLPIYYPWFNTSVAEHWQQQILSQQYQYIAIDTCGGGIICNPEEISCETAKQQMLQTINQTYNLEYYDKRGNCEYFIYKN